MKIVITHTSEKNRNKSRVTVHNLGQIGVKRNRATEAYQEYAAGSDGEAELQDGLKCEQLLKIILLVMAFSFGLSAEALVLCDHTNWRDFVWDPPKVNELIKITGRGCNLEGIDFSGEDLEMAYLRKANLSHSKLVGANLWKADLADAAIEHADLKWADLGEANLSHASIGGSDLRWADLRGTRFHPLSVYAVDFNPLSISKADMRWAKLRLEDVLGGFQRFAGMYTGWVDIERNPESLRNFDRMGWLNLEEILRWSGKGGVPRKKRESEWKPVKALPWPVRAEMAGSYCREKVRRLLSL